MIQRYPLTAVPLFPLSPHIGWLQAPLLVPLLCTVWLAIPAGAAGPTKGREIAPLSPEFKSGDYVWKPEVSPAGPVIVIVSIPEQSMFVYRNGVQIGRCTFVLRQQKGAIRGSHVYSALARVDAKGRRDWLATTSIGGGRSPDVKSLAALTTIPAQFLHLVRPIIAPGTTLILTDLPVSSQTRSSQDFRILTTDGAAK